jgi:hypothetical protein
MQTLVRTLLGATALKPEAAGDSARFSGPNPGLVRLARSDRHHASHIHRAGRITTLAEASRAR